MIYLDHAASTPLTSRCLNLLVDSLRNDFANPSSSHKLGKNLNQEIEKCRDFFLKALDAQEAYTFIFTSSATEANNMLIKGLPWAYADKILYSPADHASVVVPLETLSQKGLKAMAIPLTPQGYVDLEELEKLVDDKVKYLFLSSINNQSGILHPIKEIALLIKRKFPTIQVYVDAVQGFGKFPLNLKDGLIDGVVISGHKMGGPKGIGGLYLSKKNSLIPLLHGGPQERGLRASTQNTPLIKAFKEALVESLEHLEESLSRIQNFQTKIIINLSQAIKEISFPFIDSDGKTSPYILTFILKKIPSDVMLRHLEQKDIFLSSSSACSSRIKGKNPTFSALKIPDNLHKHVLRISLFHTTTEREVEEFCHQFISTFRELEFLI